MDESQSYVKQKKKKNQTQKEDILYDSNYMKSNYRQTEL